MSEKLKILTLNKLPRNNELLAMYLNDAGYETLVASSYEEFDQIFKEKGPEIALALIDIIGFDHDIWERCECLRMAEIPFLVIAPKQSRAIQQEGLIHGARGTLTKPIIIRELLGLIAALLEGK